jgi:hypothetical protein
MGKTTTALLMKRPIESYDTFMGNGIWDGYMTFTFSKFYFHFFMNSIRNYICIYPPSSLISDIELYNHYKTRKLIILRPVERLI